MKIITLSKLIFNEFEQLGVRYCHWKSNEHLISGLNGDTDLDVLVALDDKPKVESIFQKCNVKKFLAVEKNRYPGIEDYVGLDNESGRLIHIHLHYKLEAGEKFLKSFEFYWANDVLNHSIYYEDLKIKIADPAFELFQLILRESLKIRWRDVLGNCVGRGYFKADFYKEFNWLKERTNTEQVKSTAGKYLGVKGEKCIEKIVQNPTFWECFRLKSSALKSLSGHRRMSSFNAFIRRHVRELNWLIGAVAKRIYQPIIPFRRTRMEGGIIIAFVGVDGAGKSTVLAAIKKWLLWKLDVYPVYFGSGDGPSSVLRWPLRLFLRTFRSFRPKKVKKGKSTSAVRRLSLPRFIWAITLAMEKKKKMKSALLAKTKGMIVLSDRYPQTWQEGYNDGPILTPLRKHKIALIRQLAEWEYQVYKNCEKLGPDLLLKLLISPEESLRRKDDGMSIEELRERIHVVKNIPGSSETQTLIINCDKPLNEVLLEVKQKIWEVL